jgi:hypothetical protein
MYDYSRYLISQDNITNYNDFEELFNSLPKLPKEFHLYDKLIKNKLKIDEYMSLPNKSP